MYSELEISNDSENESTDNIGLPTYTSSPIQTKNSEPLRVLTINFQSIKNKKPEVELIVDQGLAQVHMNLLGECYIGMSIPVYHI
jgi:hypothetical protein